ncbi:hypothetical protein HX057_09255 [Myroides odoratimimus]|uniref:Uncharacterized protein n=2 Tax=Myroides odoratimimus TaxID=76832 RepID=A0ABN0EEN2_9FLAO|nr:MULTISPECIES: hypothetical protein [Myroides]EHO04758.1 hypothetical protein HMPREF9714_03623 [Myroides odoratimimus CCUG 12901]EHO12861.1 hypothetical protein HMPREF9712_00008 [Myroides odoratimimus CCUG 10230]EKB03513.1 hypothetical protein HMPREF9711_02840 [Myroides odoratimimus CCUG 3837]MDM1067130.1 hypothetical protein [Myroides odoratimimus]MDM1414448.1 hypothetical protein [Myroides odoratimimus]
MKTPHLLILIIFTLGVGAYGQTGIGTQIPSSSSELEIKSKDKGVLIPRLELKNTKDKSTIVGTEYPESLMIYHTGTKAMLAGYYFWAENHWNALVSNTTLQHYIKEIADPNSVTVTYDEGDYIFTWINKDTNIKETMKLSDVIKTFESLTSLSTVYDEGEAVLVYKPERGIENNVKLTELLKGSTVFTEYIESFVPSAVKETVTNVTRYNKEGVEENIANVPNAGMIYYKYINESSIPEYITVSQDVSNDFKTIVNQAENTEHIKNIAKTVKGNDNFYSTVKEEIIGKWDEKDVMRYIVKLNKATSFTSVELPKVISGLVVDAKLINESSNSMTRGVISKQVSGTKTVLAIGTAGTIIQNNPAGNYYVIVEYIKE